MDTHNNLLLQKWVEAIPMRNETDVVVMKFIEENILSRFGCPRQIVIDNAYSFSSIKMIEFCKKYHISTSLYALLSIREWDGIIIKQKSNQSHQEGVSRS